MRLLERIEKELGKYSEVVGSSDLEVLDDVRALLQAGRMSESDEKALRAKNSEAQSKLINLKSRLHYVIGIKKIHAMKHEGQMIEAESYSHHRSREDREKVMIAEDSEMHDMRITISKLTTLHTMCEDLLWALKYATK